MKTELEQEDIKAIAKEVVDMLKPMLVSNGKQEEDMIFNVESLAQYLEVSKQWIYERTHLKGIPHLKIDGQLRFRKSEIDKWLTSYRIPVISIPEKVLKAVK